MTVVQRPWPLVKGNGFILVSECSPGIVLPQYPVPPHFGCSTIVPPHFGCSTIEHCSKKSSMGMTTTVFLLLVCSCLLAFSGLVKQPQVFNFGSKHRENVPAPARGSSQSSRTRKTSKLSRFAIPWYRCQARLGGYFFSPHEASGIPF